MVCTAATRPVTGSSPNGPYSATSSASSAASVFSSTPPWMQSTKASKVSRCAAKVVMVTPRGGNSVGAPRPSAGGEVVTVVQVGHQCGLSGFPTQGLAGDEVGGRVVLRDEGREGPEVPRHHQFVHGNADDGQVQTAADGLGDLAKRNALVLDRVPIPASRTLLHRQ